MSKSVLCTFSSRGFIVSDLRYRSLIHFEFIFICGVRKCFSLILKHVTVHYPQYHLLKRLSPLYILISFVVNLIYMSVFVSVPQFWLLKLYNILKLGTWFLHLCSSFSKLFWLFEVFLCFHTHFKIICSSSVKTALGILIGSILNLKIALGSMVILTILILLIHRHNISL